MFQIFKSHSVKFLLIGYLMLVLLFVSFLFLDTAMLHEQYNVIDSFETHPKKMRVIIDLIEIARKRVHLSLEMLSTEDVFEKDEISQQISSLASDFIKNHQKLREMLTTNNEKDVINKQLTKIQVVIEKIRTITDLAMQDSEDSNKQARNIIITEIIPLQEKIIGDFVMILNDVQQQIHNSRDEAITNYLSNRNYRKGLVLFIFLGSLTVLVWAIKRMYFIEQRLHGLSLVDGLTGITNRRGFDETLQSEWHRSIRDKTPLSVLLIDIDHFKNYNDFYGHQQGDDCLVEISQIINSVANRSNDLAARYGGEEFAMILPNTDLEGSKIIAKELLMKIRDEKIPHEKSATSDYVTASIGLTSLTPSDNTKVDDLICAADEALYMSKKNGRNQISFLTTKSNFR
jgi:diguanylate cyclase (GGDEF)-like protein